MNRPWMLAAAFASMALTGQAQAAHPPNSIGPAWIAEDLFGVNYEHALSSLFSIDALACTSGDIDFGGMRLVLSKAEPSFQIRPSLGICMVRGELDEPEQEDSHGPWYGFIWPGIGVDYRTGCVSTTADISVIYGNTGQDEDEGYGALSASVMYMF
jgi:hypothetical protein